MNGAEGGAARTPLDLSVVVMAFNEAGSLELVVEEILTVVRQLAVHHEIIVVDDGSTDGTAQIADGLSARRPTVRVIHHRRNGGLGAVYRTGFDAARLACVTFFPADGQFPASIIAEFLGAIETNDLVLGYLPKRDEILVAKFLSACERLLYRCLFGALPKFQGVMMVRRTVLVDVGLRSRGRGWGVLMELVVRTFRGPYRVVSVPTPYRRRMAGKSKVTNVRTAFANFREMMTLRWIV